jgi:hypothetical protein
MLSLKVGPPTALGTREDSWATSPIIIYLEQFGSHAAAIAHLARTFAQVAPQHVTQCGVPVKIQGLTQRDLHRCFRIRAG